MWALLYETLRGADSRPRGGRGAAVADACLLGVRDAAAAARFRRVPDRERWSLNMPPTTVEAPRLAALRARVRTRSTEAVVFSTAAVLALAHAFDDALLLPGGGAPLTRPAPAWATAPAATLAAIVRFDSMRPGARALTAFT